MGSQPDSNWRLEILEISAFDHLAIGAYFVIILTVSAKTKSVNRF